ncbi:MAG: hypothetical protein CVU06_08475 [Bacteroidetes bacterium HGW-Bacteroidetes-22]|nr:MAG: hypothetical protein CVU06_08475 [Bacteroidetes bacterium HGW-Bacteroidetes-22]
MNIFVENLVVMKVRLFILLSFASGFYLTGFSQEVVIQPDSLFKPTLEQVDSLKQLYPVVFSNKGCGRCTTAKDFFNKNSISFVNVNLGLPENRSMMYSVAKRAAGSSLRGIKYPVIIYKDSTHWGQGDLNTFLLRLQPIVESERKRPTE